MSSLRAWLMDRLMVIVVFGVIAGVAGFVVMLSGIVPNRASSGHWAITRFFLELATARTVSTHAIGIEVPELDEPWMVLKGAGHFHTGCRPCHGGPDVPEPRIAGAMTPDPPYLPTVLPEWTTAEVFYIVKHGLKFAGMPAWPTQERDDEVWAMVAFLERLRTMDAATYRELVRPEGPAPPALQDLLGAQGPLLAECARCHGEDGLGRGTGAFPKLAGQKPAYLAASLAAYASGARNSGIMEPIAAGLADAQVQELAAHYAALEPGPAVEGPDLAAIERGAAIARDGIPRLGVPSCSDCHGPLPPGETVNRHYPRIAGQYADYLVLQLELFKAGRRGGTPYAHLMRRVARRLEPGQMRDVAAYYASLGAGEAAR